MLLWEPAPEVVTRFAVLHVPPALEENNKSRRTVALQARAFARLGGVTALLDPTGTGDSSEDHGSATWERWQRDVRAAWDWLGARCNEPRVLWGTRLGALLAAQLVASGDLAPALLVLWQPVASRRAFFKQVLRLTLGSQLKSAGRKSPPAHQATSGRSNELEVAGYDLNSQLVDVETGPSLRDLAIDTCPIVWRESAMSDSPTLNPASVRIVADWQARGAVVDVGVVGGPSFWTSQEIAEGRVMVESTTVAVEKWTVNRGHRNEEIANGGPRIQPLSEGLLHTEVVASQAPGTDDVVGWHERYTVFDCYGDKCIGVVTIPPPASKRGSVGVVVVVGGPQYRVGSHRQFVLLARALASAGIPTLRFDYRGMGDSEGEARDFQSIDDDIAAAIVALRSETGVQRCVLWGLCDGASAALMHARADPRIAGIVALNPWAHSVHTEATTQLKHYYLRRLFSAGLWRKLRAGRFSFRRSALEVAIAMRNALATPTREAQPDYLERMEQGWSRFAGPVLIILSGNDLVAREFEEWVRASAQRRDLLSRSGSRVFHVSHADHTFASRGWRDAVAKETIACLQAICGHERG